MDHRNSERGFTLPEALVSAAIAAGVIATASASLSGSLHLTKTSNAADKSLIDAQNLAAHLKSDMALQEIQNIHPDWVFETVPVSQAKIDPKAKFQLLEIIATRVDDPKLTFSSIRIAEVETP